ncbi:hypothetical protein EJ110_NYTH05612 [Nymphaea thermarum]|nr:hypothetical protein EJ110_NYTH05612 [Nymphaea thermarum]
MKVEEHQPDLDHDQPVHLVGKEVKCGGVESMADDRGDDQWCEKEEEISIRVDIIASDLGKRTTPSCVAITNTECLFGEPTKSHVKRKEFMRKHNGDINGNHKALRLGKCLYGANRLCLYYNRCLI